MNGPNVAAIFVDLDGVLVDFVGGICASHKIPNPYPPYHDCDWMSLNLDDAHLSVAGKWDICALCGIPEEEFWAPTQSHDFWRDLPATKDGQQILTAAELAVGPKKVFLLTSPTQSAYAFSGKAAWVERHLPQYFRRLLIGSCKHLCARPDHLLIDDYNLNHDEFRAAGGQVVLVPRPWNRLWMRSGHAAHCVWFQLKSRI